MRGEIHAEKALTPALSQRQVLQCALVTVTGMLIGCVTTIASAQDGKLVVGKVINLNATLDHRVVDGGHAAIFAKTVRDTSLVLAITLASVVAFEMLIVLAMGKLGGGELNYSSDIDLLFLAAANPTDSAMMAS